MGNMRQTMTYETKQAKRVYIMIGILVGALTLLFACLELARGANVNKWNADYAASPPESDSGDGSEVVVTSTTHIYDVYPYASCTNFTDPELAIKLKAEI